MKNFAGMLIARIWPISYAYVRLTFKSFHHKVFNDRLWPENLKSSNPPVFGNGCKEARWKKLLTYFLVRFGG